MLALVEIALIHQNGHTWYRTLNVALLGRLWPAVEAAKRTSLRLINFNDEGPRGISRAEPGVGAPPAPSTPQNLGNHSLGT